MSLYHWKWDIFSGYYEFLEDNSEFVYIKVHPLYLEVCKRVTVKLVADAFDWEFNRLELGKPPIDTEMVIRSLYGLHNDMLNFKRQTLPQVH